MVRCRKRRALCADANRRRREEADGTLGGDLCVQTHNHDEVAGLRPRRDADGVGP
jgi:hypothetical protein